MDSLPTNPLHKAVKSGNLRAVQRRLDLGDDLETKNGFHWTPLHVAAYEGNKGIVLLLMEAGADLEADDSERWTPLLMATASGKQDVVEDLIQFGANKEATLWTQSTPLHVAASYGRTDVLETLLKSGANRRAQTNRGNTPLHLAVKHKHGEIVAAMLQEKSEQVIDIQNDEGQTALHMAIKTEGRDDIILSLIEAGARVDIEDQRGNVALDYIEDSQKRQKLLKMAEEAAQRLRAEEMESESKQSPDVSDEDGGQKCNLPSQARDSEVAMSSHSSCSTTSSSGDEETLSSSNLGGSSTSSASEEGRINIAKALVGLKAGLVLNKRYTILSQSVSGKPHIRLASTLYGKPESVVLKFFSSEEDFDRLCELHSDFRHSNHICNMVEPIKDEAGFPPCLVFEKGILSVQSWLQLSQRSEIDKRWCLQQVLSGIDEMHSQDKVHCDIKPSNAMLFAEDTLWKLIDLDAARSDRTESVAAFTAAYAAPEVLRAIRIEETIAAQKSMDMWSFGVLAYEVLTEKKLYGADASFEDICDLISSAWIHEVVSKIAEEPFRVMLINLLKPRPGDRWTAKETMQCDLFRHSDTTTLE